MNIELIAEIVEQQLATHFYGDAEMVMELEMDPRLCQIAFHRWGQRAPKELTKASTRALRHFYEVFSNTSTKAGSENFPDISIITEAYLLLGSKFADVLRTIQGRVLPEHIRRRKERRIPQIGEVEPQGLRTIFFVSEWEEAYTGREIDYSLELLQETVVLVKSGMLIEQALSTLYYQPFPAVEEEFPDAFLQFYESQLLTGEQKRALLQCRYTTVLLPNPYPSSMYRCPVSMGRTGRVVFDQYLEEYQLELLYNFNPTEVLTLLGNLNRVQQITGVL